MFNLLCWCEVQLNGSIALYLICRRYRQIRLLIYQFFRIEERRLRRSWGVFAKEWPVDYVSRCLSNTEAWQSDIVCRVRLEALILSTWSPGGRVDLKVSPECRLRKNVSTGGPMGKELVQAAISVDGDFAAVYKLILWLFGSRCSRAPGRTGLYVL